MDLSKYLAKSNPEITLKQHTEDVMNAAEILFSMGYIKDVNTYLLTVEAAKRHDYGKVVNPFQVRLKTGMKFNKKIEVIHNVLSLYFINKEDYQTDDDYYRVAFAVLYHHDYDEVTEILRNDKELIKALLADFKEDIFEVKKCSVRRIELMRNDETAIRIKGFLHKCDYSASAGVPIEYPNDFLLKKMEEMLENWKVLCSDREDKAEIGWNQLQKFCLKNTDKNVIVVAQTGMGKTEAGLLWMGNHKGFFILPIRTAINAIYDRIRNEVLKNENIEERVALLHSENLAYYAKEVEGISPIEYRLRTKQLSIPVTVSTLDQLFDFVFKYSGYEMKLATLSYSKIIIDEIQMYGADLLAYLIYGISLITRYGGKVAILTATLSPFVRDLLVERGFHQDVIEDDFTDGLARHSLKIYWEKLNTDYILEKYLENRKEGRGNKILVVCNTVKKAQEVYEQLERYISESELNILHNKFIRQERSIKEGEIIEFGKTYSGKDLDLQNGIWIATSIVEASLDIDFDYLYTELTDINGLFQRLGRCNRKGKKTITGDNCFVFTEIEKSLIAHGDRGFIDETIYELSKIALKEIEGVQGVITERAKVDLINKYFTTERLKNSNYMIKFDKVWEKLEGITFNEIDKNDAKLRNILSFTIIPEIIYEEHKERIESCLELFGDKESPITERLSYKEEIMKYTMSVEPYVFNPKSSNTSKLIRTINIGKFEQIYVIECDYTKIGFKKKMNDGLNMW